MEIQLWKKILTPYELAVQEILVKFNHIIMEYRSADMYSPIEAVNGRVKSISNILEKCPTSILQRKIGICIDECTACVSYASFQSAN